jgi:phospholipid transport system transporter-binding protein
MISMRGDVIVVEGELTIETVPTMVSALSAHLRKGEAQAVDLSGVSDVDSSAVALLLEWQRQAGAGGSSLTWSSVPSSLENLAKLYGVQELLPLAA